MFDETVALARLVFVYIEEHVLYIEHWMWAAFWAKSKELPRALAAMGEFDEPEDMFFLRRYEVAEAIYDCVGGLVGRLAAARRGLLAPDHRPAPGDLRRRCGRGSRRRRSARRPPRSTSRSR